MKILRVLLLVLLVMVLPLRGALADAVHCAGAGSVSGQAQALAVVHDHAAAHGHHGHQGHSASHAQAHAPQDFAAEQGLVADAADMCKFCTASCSVTPFVGTVPTVGAFITTAGTSFPAFAVPPPSHLSEGQDRPPQSL